MMTKTVKVYKSKGIISFAASLLSIIVGLIFGFLLLAYFNRANAGAGFTALIATGLGTLDKFSKVLYQAAPLVFTGLSVGFAFKTGLFNIGASGQYTAGAFCALFAAIVLGMPWYISLLFSAVGGALWGFFPGFFKALFNVNEVITSIMFNWIGLYLVNLLISNIPKMIQDYWAGSISNRTVSLSLVASRTGVATVIPKSGLDKLFGSEYMNISIFISVLFALIIYVVLNKTTFGYELKACGYNRNAATYAGIRAKRNIVLSMVIAGALSGIGGGIYFLSGTAEYLIEKNLLTMGFNGIPVALLASSNPVGIVFSSLFISYIQVGGEALQRFQYSTEIINIIISVIIYLAAFSLLLKTTINKLFKNKNFKAEPPVTSKPYVSDIPVTEEITIPEIEFPDEENPPADNDNNPKESGDDINGK